jgi:hypothetical protein
MISLWIPLVLAAFPVLRSLLLGEDHIFSHQRISDNLFHFRPEGGGQDIIRHRRGRSHEQIRDCQQVQAFQGGMHLTTVSKGQ